MSRDMYAALSGAAATWSQLETLSNNIANVSTTGFRASRVRFELEGPSDGEGQVYAMARDGGVSHRDGAVAHDGQPTHFALQGRGWFTVQTPDGTMLTRDGRFELNTEGQLVTASGFPVMGEGGAIEIPQGERLSVSADGIISGSESGEIDKFALADAKVEHAGGNLYKPVGALGTATVSVEQGALEDSNTDPMSSMVELMEASRYFEAFQKAMQASDELDARLNDMTKT